MDGALRNMANAWRTLPGRIRRLAIMPTAATELSERSAGSYTLQGFDPEGALCFYRQESFLQASLKQTVTAVRTRYSYWLCRTVREDFEARAHPRSYDSGFVAKGVHELPR